MNHCWWNQVNVHLWHLFIFKQYKIQNICLYTKKNYFVYSVFSDLKRIIVINLLLDLILTLSLLKETVQCLSDFLCYSVLCYTDMLLISNALENQKFIIEFVSCVLYTNTECWQTYFLGVKIITPSHDNCKNVKTFCWSFLINVNLKEQKGCLNCQPHHDGPMCIFTMKWQ